MTADLFEGFQTGLQRLSISTQFANVTAICLRRLPLAAAMALLAIVRGPVENTYGRCCNAACRSRFLPASESPRRKARLQCPAAWRRGFLGFAGRERRRNCQRLVASTWGITPVGARVRRGSDTSPDWPPDPAGRPSPDKIGSVRGRATSVQPYESGAPAVAENGLAFPNNGPARALVTSHVADHCELPCGLARTKIRSPSLVATFLGWPSRPSLGWPVSAASPASSIAIAKVGFGRGCSRPNHRLSETGIRPSGEPDSGGSQPAP